MHWLSDGDRVLLTDTGPEFRFRVSQSEVAGVADVTPPQRIPPTPKDASRQEQPPPALPEVQVANMREGAESYSPERPTTVRLAAIGASVLASVLLIAFALRSGDNLQTPVQTSPQVNVEDAEVKAAERQPLPAAAIPVDARLVWIGFEREGVAFSYCNGWLWDGRTVVTWARGGHALQARFAGTNAVFVETALGRERAQVTQFRFHPQFNATVPDSAASRQADLALLTLDGELVPSLPPAEFVIDEATRLRPNSRLEIATCQLPTAQRPIDATNPPPVVYSQISVLDVVNLPNSAAATPLLQLGLLPAEGIEGTPVMEPSGKIVGTITRADPEEVIATPVDRLERIVRP